jgi:beta-lactamase regulating signal transducer with metallopeptidase domain
MVEWLFLNSLTAALLAVLVLCLSRPLRFGPAVRHALWLVVIVKLLTPPLVRWPWRLPVVEPLRVASETVEPSVRRLPPGINDKGERAGGENQEIAPPFLGPRAVEEFQFGTAPPEPNSIAEVSCEPIEWPDEWRKAAGTLWVVGGLVALLVQAVRTGRFQSRLKASRPAPVWLEIWVRELSSAGNVRPPQVRVLAGLTSPVVWGFGPARLIWPQGLENCLSSEGCRAVLLHELAHLRRRDHWTGWLVLTAGCVLWWHPLFWLARRQLVREAELACDAWVVSTRPQARRAYAEALLDVIELASRPVPAHALSATGRRRDVERRLTMILREQFPGRLSLRALLAVGVLALLAVPTWTPGQPPAKQAEQKSPPPADKPGSGKAIVDLDNDGFLDLFIVNDGKGGNWEISAIQPEREKKLKEVEEKLRALLKEVQALRAAQGKAGQGPLPQNLAPPFSYPVYQNPVAVDWATRVPYTNANVSYLVNIDNRSANSPTEIALSRTTYSLPHAKAEALAAFLREHVKAAVMETKSEGDSLIVTTTPAAQKAIVGLVALIQGKETAPTNAPGKPNNPSGKP